MKGDLRIPKGEVMICSGEQFQSLGGADFSIEPEVMNMPSSRDIHDDSSDDVERVVNRAALLYGVINMKPLRQVIAELDACSDS